MTLIDVDLIGNSAGIAGAINAGSNDSTFTANISITSCLFSSNHATDGVVGGAQLGYGTSVIEVRNSEFIDNHATGYGGLRVRNDFIIDSCLFVDNTASFYGAGGGISGGTGILSNSVFVNNSIDSLDEEGSSNGGGFTLWSDTNVEVVKKRMNGASAEITHWAEYDYVVINKNLNDSVKAVLGILKAERMKRIRQVGLGEFVRSISHDL